MCNLRPQKIAVLQQQIDLMYDKHDSLLLSHVFGNSTHLHVSLYRLYPLGLWQSNVQLACQGLATIVCNIQIAYSKAFEISCYTKEHYQFASHCVSG